MDPQTGPCPISWMTIVGVTTLILGILILTRPTRESEHMAHHWWDSAEMFTDPKKVPKGKGPKDGMVYVVT